MADPEEGPADFKFAHLDDFALSEDVLGLDGGIGVRPHQAIHGAAARDGCTTAPPPDASTTISPVSADAQSFFQRESAVWAFQDTPPYDRHNDENPFDTVPLLPEQAWNVSLMNNNAPVAPVDWPDVTTFGVAAPGVRHDRAEKVMRPNLSLVVTPNLTAAQQEKLRKIAMPSRLQYQSPKSADSPYSNSSGNEKGGGSSPEPAEPSKSGGRKRKSSADGEEDDDEEELDGHQPVKKTAHNMIEKRYRTNLNDKIAALRDSVPALRIMSKSARGEDTTEDREELHGLTPAHKLNKATVLSKATEYIRHLEKRNNRLIEERNNMQSRIAAFEKLFVAGAMGGSMPNSIQQDSSSFINNAPMGARGGAADASGMMALPDDMKRLLATQQMAAGQAYAVPTQPYQQSPVLLRQQQIQQQQQAQAQRWNPYLGKLMVGSLAGLMILAMVENQESTDKPEGRGLWATPHFILTQLLPSHVGFAGHHVALGALMHKIQLLLVFLLFLSVYGFIPQGTTKSEKQKPGTSSLEAVPSLASPIHVRRQAWLTSIQTVWVPRHNFLLEAAALGLKTLKYTVRNVIGVHGYQLLTGLTEEQEAARIKAWTIALDAQLAGGDIEINTSRLTLTLIASGTLPTAPLRLMMKALHVHVLLWEAPFPGALKKAAATKVARHLWAEARTQKSLSDQVCKGGVASDDELPEHLAILLEQDCDKVFTREIVQRAHNLAWNRFTTHECENGIDGMNAVVDDAPVRSPMDAIAAWYSCAALQRVLVRRLEHETRPDSSADDADLALALNVAPIGSNSQVRALVARAVLLRERRGAHISAALQAMEPSLDPNKRGVPALMDSPLRASVAPPDADVRLALRCAMASAHLQKYANQKLAGAVHGRDYLPTQVLALIRSILPGPYAAAMGLLGCTAAFVLMTELHHHDMAGHDPACADALERLAGLLRVWIGGPEGDKEGLNRDVRHAMVDTCLAVTKGAVVGIDTDQGYGSMSDCADEL